MVTQAMWSKDSYLKQLPHFNKEVGYIFHALINTFVRLQVSTLRIFAEKKNTMFYNDSELMAARNFRIFYLIRFINLGLS